MGLSRERLLSADLMKRHWLVRYGFAILIFAITIGISLLNTRYFELRLNLTIPVVLALVAVAWYAGRGPGILLGILFQATTILYSTAAPDPSIAKRVFGYFSILALYFFLALMISGLRRAQEDLREQRDLLKVTLGSIGDGVIATDTGGKITFMNPVAEKMTGWQRTEARGRQLEEVFSIINEHTREPVPAPTVNVLATGQLVGLSNHTILRAKNGSEIPIDDSAAPIKEGQNVRGVVLVFANVSERKAAERSRREAETMQRIVEAQESERRRIARDLHDHLGQRMTALRLRIESLTENVAGGNGASAAVEEVRAAASQVDRDIGFLSWELRPTELEELGLDDALSSFVREWSDQYGIDAEFHAGRSASDPDGRLPSAVETNLYRIAQEALNNILKHADAAKVSVLLQQRQEDITLIIEDDGIGFENIHRSDAGNGSRHRRHGLIGMRERAALLNGTIEIDTQPDGGGTTVLVRVPLPIAREGNVV
jgi:PAS domain S-box-containing protein